MPVKALTISSNRPRRRLAATAAVLASSTALLSACQVISPRQTDVIVDTGNGVSVDVGTVKVRNLVIVADKKGGPGVISAAIGNPTADDQTVTFGFQDGGAPAQTTIPAYETANVSVNGSRVQVTNVPAEPGAMVTLQVATKSGGPAPVQVPVLPATGEYASLAPS